MRFPLGRYLSNPNSALVLILLVIFSRLIPHPPNFTPVLSIALFSGAVFPSRWRAIAIPLLGMVLSNILLNNMPLNSMLLGFYTISWVVIGLITGLAFLGMHLRARSRGVGGAPGRPGVKGWLLYSLLAAVLFFLVSNFFVWLLSGYYPPTWEGLVTCYTMAIPFFQNTLASTVLYSAVLFEGRRLMEWLAERVDSPAPV